MNRLSAMILETNLLFDAITNEEDKRIAFHHAFLTLKAMRQICEIENIENDTLFIAAYMHDCALYEKGKESHAQRSADKAALIFKESGLFTEEEQAFMQGMIRHHSYKKSIHSFEEEMLKNADLLAKYLDHEVLDDEALKRIQKYLK